MPTKIVSAIVPIFNEQKTIHRVVASLLNSDLVSEVICVNDGSTDKSLEILQSFSSRIKLINLKRNHGKGFALATGIKKAKGEILIFFDGDITGLTENHIRALLDPLLMGGVKAVIAVLAKSPNYPFKKWDIYLSGIRVYYRNALLPHLTQMVKTGYGIEVFLNGLFEKRETKIVSLAGLVHQLKPKKWKLYRALKGYIIAGVEVSREIGKKEIISAKDYQKIKHLATMEISDDFAAKIKEISNRKIRHFWQRYILKYLKMAWRG